MKKLILIPLLPLLVAAYRDPASIVHPQPPAPRSTARQRPTSAPVSELTKAQANLDTLTRQLRSDFEKTEDYVKASDELKKASTAYEAAYKTATAGLKDKPDYAAAVTKQQEADAALASARTDPAAAANISALAGAAMDARKTVHQFESAAADADPAVKQAKVEVTAANQKLADLHKVFTDSLLSNTDYQAAKKAVEDARPQRPQRKT